MEIQLHELYEIIGQQAAELYALKREIAKLLEERDRAAVDDPGPVSLHAVPAAEHEGA